MVLSWKAYLRAGDEGGGRKLLFRIEERLGSPIALGEFGRDDEDTGLYRCTFTTGLDAESEDALCSALTAAGRLAPAWEVGGLPPSGPLWGVAAKGIVVSGVTWLHFSVGE